MKVPFLDLIAPQQELKKEMHSAFERVLNSGWFVLGQECGNFEKAFADYCGVKHCIGVGNGLEALHLILLAAGIGPGDEVIVPSNTFIATWFAVTYTGAIPVPVDPNPVTFNIEPLEVEKRISSKTKAVIAVHLYGRVADMHALEKICVKHNVKLFEDAAQAHGSILEGKKSGSLGLASGFSFYPGKNLGALGDAGAVMTNDDDIASQVRLLRNYGSVKKYYTDVIGYNSRLDEVQAALLTEKLKTLDVWNSRRSKIAKQYSEAFSEIPALNLPESGNAGEHVWHLYVVRYAKRADLAAFLTKRGIGTLIHYPVPPHLSAPYLSLGYKGGEFPIAEDMANTVLSLPIGPHLTDEQVLYVIQSVKLYFGKH